MRIRIISTGSGNHAIQVVSKVGRDLKIHQHIGTFVTAVEKERLLKLAREYIATHTDQLDLFSSLPASWTLGEVEYINSQPLYLYRLLTACYNSLGFPDDPLIRDLVIARLYQPASKRETGEVLADTFGVSYSLRTIYRHLKKAIATGLKDDFQKALINYAKISLNDPLKLVFYDVTTLAFSSQTKTSLKDFGFSKDHRHQDTQVVVGLVVNAQGFPLYFDVFSGNTFEGGTFIQVVKGIRQLLNSPELVVVADAGMLSKKNMDELHQAGILFVVGARVSNLSTKLITQLNQNLKQQDGATTELAYQDYRLLADYSARRAKKDLHDLTKQWDKAEKALETPNAIVRRYRFIQGTKHTDYSLNTKLKDKATTLIGIKGYLTNTQLTPATITAKYHDLWRVEKAFRITKSDLEARPIFLRLEATIKAHLTVVFAGLAIAKLLEIQTQTSVHQILKTTSKILTLTIRHTKNQLTTTAVTTPPDSVKLFCGKLNRIYSIGY
jgi:transposase